MKEWSDSNPVAYAPNYRPTWARQNRQENKQEDPRVSYPNRYVPVWARKDNK